ncbi:MAG TPA: hypothetical protein VII98_05720 [Solirubrobacteraceae bacterium]
MRRYDELDRFGLRVWERGDEWPGVRGDVADDDDTEVEAAAAAHHRDVERAAVHDR